jgi:hypothetical protein
MLKQLTRSGPFAKALFTAGLLGASAAGLITVTVAPAKAVSISGPGGCTGGVGCNAQQVGDTFIFNEFFTGVGSTNYLDKNMGPLSAGTKYTLQVNVRNDSALTWHDFHFEVQGFPKIATLSNPSSTVFSTVTPPAGGSTVVWSGGTVADDGAPQFNDVSFSFDFTPTQNGLFNVRQYASVPGPLPILGVGAVVGFSRKLRKRINASKKPAMISTIG